MESSASSFFEIREAIQNNPILLADEVEGIDEDEVNDYVNNKVREGGWITIGSNEDIAIDRHNGFCNMIYIEVSSDDN